MKTLQKLLVYASLLVPSLLNGQLFINEVDSDQESTDSAEFIELYNAGGSAQVLDGYVLVLFDGLDDAVRVSYDLSGYSIPAGGFFVIGASSVPNVNFTPSGWTTNAIQNGPDAVALYQGDIGNFAANTPVGSIVGTLIDAVVHGTGDPDDEELLAALNTVGGQVDENSGGNPTTFSIARLPDGGTALDTSTYVTQPPTPGVSNEDVTITLTMTLDKYTVSEADGEFVILGTLTTNIKAFTDIVVTLSSSDTSELTVDSGSSTVTIFTNSSEATFDLSAVNDALTDGSQLVTITATATDVVGDAVNVIVTDDEITETGTLLNEIRFRQTGVDTDEFVELYDATPNASLNGYSLLVIGSDPGGAAGSGYILKAITFDFNESLNGNYYVVGTNTMTLGTPDKVETFDFDDSENLTVLLVNAFSGAEGDDLDTNDDGTLDTTPWAGIRDGVVVMREPNIPANGRAYEYGSDLLLPMAGPLITGSPTSPGNIQRQSDGALRWVFEDNSLSDFCSDTPGTTNGTIIPRLSISLSPSQIEETAGAGGIVATITRTCGTTGALLVNLTSSDTSELDVPATATIPEGNESVAVALDVIDEAEQDGTQTVTVTASATGYDSVQAVATITDDDTPVFTNLVINEVNYQNLSTDTQEFVELYHNTGTAQPLDGLVLVFYNGGTDQIYRTVDLTAKTAPADGYFVVGSSEVSNVDYDPGWTSDRIQNGPGDAVALYIGSVANLANGTHVNNVTETLIDAVVYAGDDVELLAALLPGQSGIASENADGSDSTSRVPDGGTALSLSTYSLVPPTPGTSNGAATGPTEVWITSFSRSATGEFTLNWAFDSGSSGVNIKTSPDLVDWSNTETSITEGTTTYTDTNPVGTRLFYRVEIP